MNLYTSSSKKILITGILFVIPLLTVLLLLDNIFTNALLASNHEDISYLNRVVNGEVNADVLITGSSRALVQFDCNEIVSNKDKTCFNMGMNGTGLQMQLPVLEAYLEANSKPDLIIQEVGITTFNEQPEEKLVYNPSQYAPFLNNDILYEQISKLNHEAWKIKYIPFYDYIIYRDNMYDAIESLKGSNLESRRDENGFRPTNRKWDGSFDKFKELYPTGNKIEINPQLVDYLEEIIKLARSKNISMVLVYPPEYIENQRLTINREEVVSVFEELASKYNIKFINFSNNNLSFDKSNFYNSQHMRAEAAKSFSKDLRSQI